jgi:hypothetical protein
MHPNVCHSVGQVSIIVHTHVLSQMYACGYLMCLVGLFDSDAGRGGINRVFHWLDQLGQFVVERLAVNVGQTTLFWSLGGRPLGSLVVGVFRKADRQCTICAYSTKRAKVKPSTHTSQFSKAIDRGIPLFRPSRRFLRTYCAAHQTKLGQRPMPFQTRASRVV